MTEAFELYEGDCIEIFPTLANNSIDFIFSDPPYPFITREYGYWTEETWFSMMQEVVRQSKRVLTAKGSAVFILQPNSEKVGKIRPWLWKFLAWCCEEWNIIQDAYWWNFTPMPTALATQYNLLRSSLKYCVWLGQSDCNKYQKNVLWLESEANKAARLSDRFTNDLVYQPSGHHYRRKAFHEAAGINGGVTPFNVLPISNGDSKTSAGAEGHGAGTPNQLVNWWLRYCTQQGDVVLDMFNGSGTTGIEALKMGRRYIGIEKFPKYVEISKRRLSEQASKPISMNLWDDE